MREECLFILLLAIDI